MRRAYGDGGVCCTHIYAVLADLDEWMLCKEIEKHQLHCKITIHFIFRNVHLMLIQRAKLNMMIVMPRVIIDFGMC